MYNEVLNYILQHKDINEDNLNSTFDELGIDSLDSIELVMDLEKEFSITIPDKEVDSFETPQDVLNYFKK